MKSHKHPGQRVGVFVDASNMYFAAQNLYKANLNYGNLLKTAVAGRQLVRAFAYVIESDNNKEKDFFSALQDLGFETRIKPLQVFQGGAKKGDWDVGLAIDVVRSLPMLDTVVLVSGDGDYVDMLEYVRGHGRRTEVMAFKKNTSSKLIDECDEFTDLAENKRRYLIR